MSARTRKNQENAEQGGSQSWMMTFSDLSTLLLTFFVLLLSMSSLDDLKLKSAFHNFTASCGILPFKTYGEIYRPRETLIEGLNENLKDALMVRTEEQMSKHDVASDLTKNPLKIQGSSVSLQNIENGFKITFGQDLLFDSGSTEIREEMKSLLDRIAKFILISSYQIYIDGHADSLPIRTGPYQTNNELSLIRAYNVMEYLIQKGQIPSHLVSMAGYGENRPVASNKTPEGRAKNRRVEIIFKNQQYF